MREPGREPDCLSASGGPKGPGAAEALVMYLALSCYAMFLGPAFVRAFGKASTVAFSLGLGLIPFAYAWLRGYDVRVVFALKRPSVRQVCGGLSFAAGVFLLVYLASGIASGLIPAMRRSAGRVDAGISAMPFWLGILEIVALPAVFEELLFRGFIQSGLRRSAGPVWTVVLCGVLFALMHGDLSRIPFTAALGVALACALRETSSLAVPAAMHAAHNLVLFLMIRVSAASRLAAGGKPGSPQIQDAESLLRELASGPFRPGFAVCIALLLGLWILAGYILARVGYRLLSRDERAQAVSIEVEEI